MAYEIGGIRKFSAEFNAKALAAGIGVATKTSSDPVRREIEGTRAFALGRDGEWREIFRAVGEHSTCTWDSKEQALRSARAAHKFMNR